MCFLRVGTVRLVAGLLALALLVGCSANRFLYNRADTFVRWAVDDYVDFTSEQQQRFDDNLDVLLDWHRQVELPQYREFIFLSIAALDDGVTIDEAIAISEAIEQAVNRLQAEFIELLLLTGEDLSEQQILDFLAELDRQQQEFAEERLVRDEETYAADAAKSLEGLAKRLLGRLDEAQQSLIASRSKELTRIDRLWYDDRTVWGATLRTILETRAPDWPSDVRALSDARSSARTPAYVAGIDHNGDVILELLVDIINGRTERQDRKMRRFLDGLIADIDALTIGDVAEASVIE